MLEETNPTQKHKYASQYPKEKGKPKRSSPTANLNKQRPLTVN